MKDKTQFILVIDTDQYAGNFERELTAYCTGTVGECEVGSEYIEEFADEVGEEIADRIEEIIDQVADENGCHRPCAIWETPNRVNDGYGNAFNEEEYTGDTKYPSYESVAIFFTMKPSQEIIDLIASRAKEFPGEFKVTGLRLIEKRTVTTEVEVKL